MTPKHREETVNTQLAVLISKMGVTAEAETILRGGDHRPDVMFSLRGLRVAIEGKFADHPNAENVVLGDAKHRVQSGIAHIAAAAVYPTSLKTTPTSMLEAELEKSTLKFMLVSELGQSNEWNEGTPEILMAALRRAQEMMAQDDVVQETAEQLSRSLASIAVLWRDHGGACDRLCRVLGVSKLIGETKEETADRRETAAKVSALVLANAYIFQEMLSQTDERVDTLRKAEKNKDLLGSTAKHWRWIWENINYVPIFQLAERVLDELPESKLGDDAIRHLIAETQEICKQQSALRHDLMGRIYHWLLHDKKFLGTYYTSVSAATLLLRLTLSLDWPIDFGSPRELADFKVADLACGTGTLLMAATQSLTDNYIKARLVKAVPIGSSLAVLHSTLMQNVIHGYDILPTAVHLTASTLALLAPDVAFRQMNLFVMPTGMDHGVPRLGSLDFFDGPTIKTQFSLDDTQLDAVRTGAGSSGYSNAKVPKINLCVMNPPFVSSRYGNKTFGTLPAVRDKMKKELSKLAKKFGVKSTAGLGAMFVPLADLHLVEGGRLAFVLPVALATGEAWKPVRKLLADRYHLEYVITSHDPLRPNFSENTALSEVMFVARKLKSREKSGNTIFLNLRKNPKSIHDAMDLANRVMASMKAADIEAGPQLVLAGNVVLAELCALQAPTEGHNWVGALFSQSALMEVYWRLEMKSCLQIPGDRTSYKLPLTRLDSLGTLGYDVRDIVDAFEVVVGNARASQYSAFWNHDAKNVVTIEQKPNSSLLARTTAIEGRKLKSASDVWAPAGTILLVSRLWPITHKVLAVGLNKKALGNTWWAFNDEGLTEEERKCLLLWLNSSFGLLMYFGHRVTTRGAWMQMKKPGWSSTNVLNVKELTPATKRNMAAAYDQLAGETLLPLADLDKDDIRADIDKVICGALKLPSIKLIRELLANEPGLSGNAAEEVEAEEDEEEAGTDD